MSTSEHKSRDSHSPSPWDDIIEKIKLEAIFTVLKDGEPRTAEEIAARLDMIPDQVEKRLIFMANSSFIGVGVIQLQDTPHKYQADNLDAFNPFKAIRDILRDGVPRTVQEVAKLLVEREMKPHNQSEDEFNQEIKYALRSMYIRGEVEKQPGVPPDDDNATRYRLM